MEKNVIIFRHKKFYRFSFTKSKWEEIDFTQNKSFNRLHDRSILSDIPPDIENDLNKNTFTGRIIHLDKTYYIYNNITPNKESWWRVFDITTKTMLNKVSKSVYQTLQQKLMEQTKEFVKAIHTQENATDNTLGMNTNISSGVGTTVNTNTTEDTSPKNAIDVNQKISTIAKTISKATKSILTSAEPTEAHTNNIHRKSGTLISKQKNQRLEILPSHNEYSESISPSQASSSKSKSIIAIVSNIDKNVLGMTNALKSLNGILMQFLDRQKILEQIAENFANAKTFDYQNNSFTETNSILRDIARAVSGAGGGDGGGGIGWGGVAAGAAAGAGAGKMLRKRGGPVGRGTASKDTQKSKKTGGGTASKNKKSSSKRGKAPYRDAAGKFAKKPSFMSKLGRGLKGFGMAGLGSLALDFATDELEERGYKREAAVTDTGSTILGDTALGAMIGSVVPGIGTAVGAGIGATVGTGRGLYNNYSKIFNTDTKSTKGPVNAVLGDITGLGTEVSKNLDEPISTNIQKNPQEQYKVEKEQSEKTITDTKSKAIQLARINNIEIDEDSLSFKSDNKGNITSIKDKSGRNYEIKNGNQSALSSIFEPQQKDYSTPKIDEKKFAAKDYQKYQEFINYRQAKFDDYLSDKNIEELSPEERDKIVREAQEQAERDAARKYGDTPQEPTAVPQNNEPGQPAQPTAVRSDDGTQIGVANPREFEVKSDTVYDKSTNKSDLMKGTYEAFRKAGFSEEQSKALVAEVGRENSFDKDTVFGTHVDPHNKARNTGFFSWQGERGDKLYNKLKSEGLVDKDGNIIKNQRSLEVQAEFAKEEMQSRKEFSKTKKDFLENPNIDAKKAGEVLGKDYIKWRYDDPRYMSGHTNRDRYRKQIDKLVENQGIRKETKDGSKILDEAKKNIGLNESQHETELRSYLKTGNKDTEIRGKANAWCAKYVNSVLEHQGIKSTGKANARSYLDYGKGVWKQGDKDMSGVRPGDIAVFNRDGGRGGRGHVAIVESVDPKTGKITYVGGNQSGKGDGEVTRSSTDINKKDNELLAIRRPEQVSTEQSRKELDEKEMAIQRNVEIAQEELARSQTQQAPQQQQVKKELLEPTKNNVEQSLPSGQQIGEASASINTTKDSMMMPQQNPQQQSGGGALSGGGSLSRGKPPRNAGDGSPKPNSDGSGVAPIMGHGINIRNNEASLLNMQYNLVRTV